MARAMNVPAVSPPTSLSFGGDWISVDHNQPLNESSGGDGILSFGTTSPRSATLPLNSNCSFVGLESCLAKSRACCTVCCIAIRRKLK